MKTKITLLVSCMLLTSVLFGFALPATKIINTIVSEQNDDIYLTHVLKAINDDDFEEAMKNFEKLSDKNKILLNSHKDEINKMLKNYKKILINKVSSYNQQNLRDQAISLIESKIKYYPTDENLNNMLARIKAKQPDTNFSLYTGKIEHLTFKNIISYPDAGLDTKNTSYKNNDDEHITPSEFEKILGELYSNNYVLVSTSYLMQSTTSDNNISMYLPNNKKPVILSLQHYNLDNNSGFSNKIILDRNRNIASHTSKKSINNRVTYDQDFITILEKFIQDNPNFSLNNSKALLLFNAYEGILGYKTERNNISFKQEVKKVIKILKKLDSLGYEFGYNGYDKPATKEKSDLDFTKDISKWKKDIEPILDECIAFKVNTENLNLFGGNLNYKLTHVLENGFKLLLSETENYQTDSDQNVDLKTNASNKYYINSMKKVSGKTLRSKTDSFSGLFDPIKIYDNEYRKVPLFHM